MDCYHRSTLSCSFALSLHCLGPFGDMCLLNEWHYSPVCVNNQLQYQLGLHWHSGSLPLHCPLSWHVRSFEPMSFKGSSQRYDTLSPMLKMWPVLRAPAGTPGSGQWSAARKHSNKNHYMTDTTHIYHFIVKHIWTVKLEYSLPVTVVTVMIGLQLILLMRAAVFLTIVL